MLRRCLLVLLLLHAAGANAQTALELTDAQFGLARDSLLRAQALLDVERRMFLAEMRENACDTTWRWHLAERCLETRIMLRAPFDTLQTLNAAQLEQDAHAALYMDLSAQEVGERIHGQLLPLHAELLLLCPDATCRLALETQQQAFFGGLSPEEWGIRTFYSVPPIALQPVILHYINRSEIMVNTVIGNLYRACQLRD